MDQEFKRWVRNGAVTRSLLQRALLAEGFGWFDAKAIDGKRAEAR
jgi:hypothetical protein